MTAVPQKERTLPGPAAAALEEFLFHLSLVRSLSKLTVAAYGSDLRALLEALAIRHGIVGPAQISPAHLRGHLMGLHEAGRQPATVARVRSAMRTFFAFLIEEGMIQEDPSADLDAPPGWRRIPRALSVAEVSRLLESIAGQEPLDLRDRAMLEVAYGTGARVSELLGLRLDDCGWEQRTIRLQGKGSRVRFVPIGKSAMSAILDYTERARPHLSRVGQERARLFLNARGGALGRMGFWKILKKRAVAAGLEQRVHPHLLRHSFATHMLRNGASLRVVQELLGHARLATTQIYTSVDQPYLQGMHQRFHPRG